MGTITIYWGARLFNQAERIWNAMCAKALRERGYQVILPQEEAEKYHFGNGVYDLIALTHGCISNAISCDVGCFCLDGPDVDSGTAFEAGAKVGRQMVTGEWLSLGIRTDFRGQSEDPETGVNAMFRLLDDIVVCRESDSVETLADLIDTRIKRWVKQTEQRECATASR